jgi:glycine hydroxymethyltransferase
MQIVLNAKALAQSLMSHGIELTTGGTDNHLMVANVFDRFHITGRQAEIALREAGITVNRNAIPFDKNGPWYTSGIRLGTPALTTRGLKEKDMAKIGDLIAQVLAHSKSHASSKAQVIVDEKVLDDVKKTLSQILERYPLYPDLMID